MRPRRDSSTVSNVLEEQSGLRQNCASAGKAKVPQAAAARPEQRRRGAVLPRREPALDRGDLHRRGHQPSRSMMVALACPPPSHMVWRP